MTQTRNNMRGADPNPVVMATRRDVTGGYSPLGQGCGAHVQGAADGHVDKAKGGLDCLDVPVGGTADHLDPPEVVSVAFTILTHEKKTIITISKSRITV